MVDKERDFYFVKFEIFKNGLNKPKSRSVHLSQQIEFQEFLQPFVLETLPFHFQPKNAQTAG